MEDKLTARITIRIEQWVLDAIRKMPREERHQVIEAMRLAATVKAEIYRASA